MCLLCLVRGSQEGVAGGWGPVAGRSPSWALLPPQSWQPPHLRRFQMGWKYLEVLIAKMMLGTRKKVHHARQNQKAFWNRG